MKRSSSGKHAMATSEGGMTALISPLRADDWPTVLRGIDDADRWLRAAPPGELQIGPVVDALVRLAGHQKWEVRRAIANVAARMNHPAFEPVLARFVGDDNALVREAARRAALRRRDWQNASAFGKQHEERINATLDDIEGRFGLVALQRASGGGHTIRTAPASTRMPSLRRTGLRRSQVGAPGPSSCSRP